VVQALLGYWSTGVFSCGKILSYSHHARSGLA
jgi:hypothetical protein